jgi:hypothetical protein
MSKFERVAIVLTVGSLILAIIGARLYREEDTSGNLVTVVFLSACLIGVLVSGILVLVDATRGSRRRRPPPS